LTPATRSGIIQAEDGCRVPFVASAVADGFAALAVGDRVRFDCDSGWSQATAVRPLRDPSPADGRLDLRYMGFDQAKNVRQYNFTAVAGGRSTRRFVVTADVALFLKHGVAMQEGPVLCLRKLLADLETSPEPRRHELGNDDLVAYTSSIKAAALHRKMKRRPPPQHEGNDPPATGTWGRTPGPR